MKKLILVIFICLFAQLVNCSIFSQEEEIELGEIVITATKTETKLKDLPFAGNVISAEEIFKKPTFTIDQILKAQPGVQAIRPHPSTHGVFITTRGQGLTNQIIALDGQPINDGYNGYVRYGVLPSAIWERVEVIRGPHSALFGPSAMGGAINFVPKPFLKENELKMQMGSFGIRSISFLYGTTLKDKLNVALFADEKDVEGYTGDFVVLSNQTTTAPQQPITEVTGWERTSTPDGKPAYKIGDRGKQYSKEHRSLYLGLSYKLKDRDEITLNYLYGRQNHGFSGERTYLKDNAGKPVNTGNIKLTDDGTTYYLTISPVNFLDMWGECGQDVLSVKYKSRIRDNISLSLFTGLNTRVQKWAAPTAGATSSGGPGRKGTPEGTSTRIGAEANITFGKNKLVSGIEMVSNSGGAKRETLSNWRNINSVTKLEEDAKGKHRITSFYIVDEFTHSEKLNIWLGGRYDSWKKYDGKTITPTKTTTFPDETVSRFSPKLGVLLKLSEFLKIKTSYGEGFRVPASHELYRQLISSTSVSLGNPDLKPETNRCIDFGIEVSPSLWKPEKKIAIKTVKLNHFVDKTKDLIYIKNWTAPHPDTGVNVTWSQRQNAGKSENKGWEIEINGEKFKLDKGWEFSWFANISLQKPKITENTVNPQTVGKIVPYAPKEMYNLGIEMTKEPYFLTLSMHKRGKVYLRDDNSDKVNNVVGSMDPFTVWDLTGGYKITKNVTFSVAITNLFDKKYYSMHNQLAPGRSFSCEMNVKF